jgi:hypothetical protein
MAPSANTSFRAVLGTLMVGLGLFIALRLMATAGRPLTGRLWLDAAFALFFLARGGMYFWGLRQRR